MKTRQLGAVVVIQPKSSHEDGLGDEPHQPQRCYATKEIKTMGDKYTATTYVTITNKDDLHRAALSRLKDDMGYKFDDAEDMLKIDGAFVDALCITALLDPIHLGTNSGITQDDIVDVIRS